ncbi:T6SS effector amidase Tae4 family protein, partial [Flavobacterium sp.]|uniref:T6SS effector amidase Tae4 family protein n=1 Tax=Flavobacterium sp. TaxID=239 RepID=UPI003B9BD17D
LEFVKWTIDYLIEHPEVTWEQFKNWFFTENEGDDLFYDENYWNNPNLNFPQQNLPTWNDFLDGIPVNIDNTYILGPNNIFPLIGGDVLQLYLTTPSDMQNTCAARISIALIRSGIEIPYIPGQTVKGGGAEFGDKYFFLNAKALNEWMRKTFGTHDGANGTPINGNHSSYFPTNAANDNSLRLDFITNKRGIFSSVSTPAHDLHNASGHADLLISNGTIVPGECITGCNLDIPLSRIDIWILN